MKDDDDECSWLDHKAWMKPSWILNIHPKNVLGRWSRKYTLLGIFSAQKERKKKMENHVFDAYMCRRLKDQDVGTTFSCLILARTRKRWRRWWRSWKSFWASMGERESRGFGREWKSDVGWSCSMVLGDFNDGNYLGNGLANILGMVSLDLCWKILGGREGERGPTVGRERKRVWSVVCS